MTENDKQQGESAVRAGDSYDIVHISMEDWEGVWRRNQPVATEFARRGAAGGRRILYVGLAIDVSHALRKGKWQTIRHALRGAAQPPAVPEAENVFLLKPVKWLPNTLRWGRAFNQWHELRQIKHACRTLGIKIPVLWMNPHYALHLVGKLSERLSVYDIGDDWTIPNQKEWLRRLTIWQDAELCRRADVVIVVSEHLYELKKNLARRLHHIPNGVYTDRYTAIQERTTLSPHPITAEWERPVLGYTGTLHAERVNVDMILNLARGLQKGTVALVGPSLLDAPTTKLLEAEPNIRLTGAVPFAEMPRVMNAFDVCIVPHVVSAFTESLSPLKLYEYLASGLPTVSTPISGFRDHPEFVYLASGDAEFRAAIETALNEDKSLPARRQERARAYSWDARMDAIEAALADALAEKPVTSPVSATAATTTVAGKSGERRAL